MTTEAMDSIERVRLALEDIRQGKMVIVTDDEDRENEGDLCMAAELCTPETINFMASKARGLICLSLQEEWIEKLELPMMVDENRASRSTAFTISIEARSGVTTGISAADRCHTVLAAVATDVRARDIVSPGHIFPLKAKPGGVLQRTGHTEGSVDLARMAGLHPSGVICEIMKDDGTMARYPDLVKFAEEHGLRLLSIADLIEYRLSRERLIQKKRQEEVTLEHGTRWTAHLYQVDVDDREFLALGYGDYQSQTAALVRVHTSSVLGDVVGMATDKRVSMRESIRRIEEEGAGVILVLPVKSQVGSDFSYFLDQPVDRPRQEHGTVLREYGLGAQVLADLGLSKIRILTNRARRIPSLDGYGLEVVEQLILTADETREPRATH